MFETRLFRKPYWLRPEINMLNYWVHLGILAFVVLGVLQLWKGGAMLTWLNFFVFIPLLAVGDAVAHTILGLD